MKVQGVGGIGNVTWKGDKNDVAGESVQDNTGIGIQQVYKEKVDRKDLWVNPLVAGQDMSIGEQHLIQTIERANRALKGVDKRFEFSIHEDTKEIMVKVINDETDEVIREIPPEKILDMVAKMWELAGILVDRKV
jgi:flagellar protein FlaG